jgi:hypothetical protein
MEHDEFGDLSERLKTLRNEMLCLSSTEMVELDHMIRRLEEFSRKYYREPLKEPRRAK